MLKLLASAFTLSLMPALSLAAEPIMVPIDSSGRGVSIADTPMDWAGFYAGVYGAVQASRNNGVQPGIGVTVGVNAQIDFVLVGTEVSLHGLIGDSVDTAYGQVLGRTGLLLNDDVLLYAAAGYGWDIAGGEGNALAGGGLEFALNDGLSLNAQYLRGFNQGAGNSMDQITFGARFHF